MAKHMGKIIGSLNVVMTVEEVNYYNSLVERDTAKAVKSGGGTIVKCPSCNSVILTGDKFCRLCGQRLDTDNTEIGGE